jgi:hypothetical protein
MAHTKAWLTKRVKIDGKWKVKQPFYNRSGSLSDKVLDGSERRLVPGVFVMEWYDDTGKRQRRTLGTSPFDAQIELEHQLRRLADIAEGRPVVKEADPGKHRFDSAAEAYYAIRGNSPWIMEDPIASTEIGILLGYYQVAGGLDGSQESVTTPGLVDVRLVSRGSVGQIVAILTVNGLDFLNGQQTTATHVSIAAPECRLWIFDLPTGEKSSVYRGVHDRALATRLERRLNQLVE